LARVTADAPGDPVRLVRTKVVVTGVTGQVGLPLAESLAADNEVYGAARFSDPAAADRLAAAGVRCVPVDLAAGDVGGLPADAEVVLHFAVAKSNRWPVDLDANVGGLAALMEHHRGARAFLHCSTAAVYRPDGHRPLTEDDALGDNHGVWPFLATYSIAKIAAEATARWGARRFDLPTTIARLSVPYGDHGGWPAVHLEMLLAGQPVPVHVSAPSVYNPIHEDDIVAMVPGLLACASVPATTLNWGGEPVSIEEWCAELAELAGVEARFAPTDRTIETTTLDLTELHRRVGPAAVGYREGLAEMVAARHPELTGR